MKNSTYNTSDLSRDLLKSYYSLKSKFTMNINEAVEWLGEQNKETHCFIEEVPLAQLNSWYFDDGKNLRHRSGKFFSIEGLHVATNVGIVKEWYQPVINQPEVGILGIICQKKDGVLHFLMQAKIEPGNVNVVQISPTLQATRSNFTQVHGGKQPLFLEWFRDLNNVRIIVDQLQSEQGARFHRKRNRNMIIEIPENINLELKSNFAWFTLGQLKKIAQFDNLINMDARTVLSCLMFRDDAGFAGSFSHDSFESDLFESLREREYGIKSIEEIISWFTKIKAESDLESSLCSILDCDEWLVEEMCIRHNTNKYFRVIGADIEIQSREVKKWCQPLVQQKESGIAGFIIKKINGLSHILVQAKLESGNLDIVEMAPSVQCITGSYLKPEYHVPYLDVFLDPLKYGKVRYDCLQSEEGGRFYKEQNRYVVVEVTDDFPVEIEPFYTWMTLGQAKQFIKYNNYFNVEARSLIACFSPI